MRTEKELREPYLLQRLKKPYKSDEGQSDMS